MKRECRSSNPRWSASKSGLSILAYASVGRARTRVALFARRPVSGALEFESKFEIFAKSLWSVFRKFPFCGDGEGRLVEQYFYVAMLFEQCLDDNCHRLTSTAGPSNKLTIRLAVTNS